MYLPGSAREGGAIFEGEGQAAIRVGRGVVQQAAPELFAEGGDLAVLLFQNPEEVLHRAAPVPDVADLQCDRMVSTLYEDEAVCTEKYKSSVAKRMGIPNDEVEPMDDSIIARIAQPISVIFKPLGFGDWKPTVASVTGLVAKEDVVGTFGVLYAYDDNDGEEELEEAGDQIWGKVAEDFNAFSGGQGKLAAYCFLLFNLLCAPCFAAIGAIKREMNSPKWTWFAIGYHCGFAYVIALIVWQLGLLFAGAANPVGMIVALILLALLGWQLFRPYKEAQKLAVK